MESIFGIGESFKKRFKEEEVKTMNLLFNTARQLFEKDSGRQTTGKVQATKTTAKRSK